MTTTLEEIDLSIADQLIESAVLPPEPDRIYEVKRFITHSLNHKGLREFLLHNPHAVLETNTIEHCPLWEYLFCSVEIPLVERFGEDWQFVKLSVYKRGFEWVTAHGRRIFFSHSVFTRRIMDIADSHTWPGAYICSNELCKSLGGI